MDERILVEVYVPAVQKSLEIFIPSYQTISDIKQVLMVFLEETWDLENNTLSSLQWYAMEKGYYLNQSLSFNDHGIQSGETILLI